MFRILAVCKGNRSRSPMFEALLQLALQENGRTDVVVESAGTIQEAANHPAEEGALVAAKRVGLDLSGHVSRWVGDLNLRDFHINYCMEPSVRDGVREFNLPPTVRIILVNEEQGGIPNPYQKGQEAYDESLEVIRSVVGKIVRDL